MNVSEKLFISEVERTRDLVRKPDWYMDYGNLQKVRALGIGAVQSALSGSVTQARHRAKQQQLAIFEQLPTEGAVRLGDPHIDELEDWDDERAPIDHVMIHHSNRAEGLTRARLNAMHLLRLYVPRYLKGDIVNSAGELQPIYSGHFDSEDNQVFCGYHWKVDQDGESERLLQDSALAWHAGNWDMNKRSVAIMIDDDLTEAHPTGPALNAVIDILSEHYRHIHLSSATLLGHHATFRTLCPGNAFEDGWKQEILAKLSKPTC